MPSSNATNTTLPGNFTEASPTAPAVTNSEQPPTTRYPFVYGPIGVHERKPGGVVGADSTGQMTGLDSGGSLGIVMAVALVAGLVLMLLLWWKAGEQLDDEEQTLLEGSEGRTVDAGEAEARTEAEVQPETSGAQESSATEKPPDDQSIDA